MTSLQDPKVVASSARNESYNLVTDQVDLMGLFRAIWRGKLLIFGCVLIFLVASVFYAKSLPNLYVSTAVVSPADSKGGHGFGSLAGQFGGLASLAGISVGGAGANKTAEALEILQSWAFIEEFINDQNIAPLVLAVVDWRSDGNVLVFDEQIYQPKEGEWMRQMGSGKEAGPSSWEMYMRFKRFLSVEEDKATGFVRISIEYYSPRVAQEWVVALVNKINSKLKTRDSANAERNITFLKEQIERTPLASMQTVFYNLIEEQTKTLMLAKGSEEYVFKTVNEARVPEKHAKPKRAIIVVVGVFLGVLLGVMVALLRFFVRL